MRIALVNPAWTFDGSIYFGCRDPHLPLELGYTKGLLEAHGHDVLLADAQLGLAWRGASHIARLADLADALADFRPDATVVTTAPGYLSWRCPPPELRVPRQTFDAIREVAGTTIVVGPHASTTPRATLRKLRADVAVLGECEDVIARFAETPASRWRELDSIAWLEDEHIAFGRGAHVASATDVRKLPSLRWPRAFLARHAHHHSRFDQHAVGGGAEVEASRPYPSMDEDPRDAYRKRPLGVVLAEIDALVAHGVRYVYFIDEVFGPDRALLDALAQRDVAFGVQVRIEQWTPELLARLGRAGCVSLQGPAGAVPELFVVAKRDIPFVQAHLDAKTAEWRDHLLASGVCATDPTPVFPYPGSAEFQRRFGACGDDAWERAYAEFLKTFGDQPQRKPRPLTELELSP